MSNPADFTDIAILPEGAPARRGRVRIGTRGSALAVTQTSDVARALASATGLEVGLVIVTTHGDVSRASLSQLGGTGVFVSALRDALLTDRCDIVVHSLKDLPTAACPGIALGATPSRADSRDALVARDGLSLASLPRGAKVGTGSPRRKAQLLAVRDDLDVHDIRGNVDTRMARVGADLDAVVLAAAGLDRLGHDTRITERFDAWPAAPGQGALAVEARSGDDAVLAAAARIDDRETRAAVLAERAVLATLEAGCAAPVAARARIDRALLSLTGAVYSLDGSRSLRAEATGSVRNDGEAAELGARAARELLERGAADIAPLGESA